ncbi:hypothetical protein AB1484_10235 [Parafrankia sp. FMc6]|uniref:hypothetical protein n=1 Tax=Parafrankia soli TaxID=2599596 RepID=UPI0034D5FDB4
MGVAEALVHRQAAHRAQDVVPFHDVQGVGRAARERGPQFPAAARGRRPRRARGWHGGIVVAAGREQCRRREGADGEQAGAPERATVESNVHRGLLLGARATQPAGS